MNIFTDKKGRTIRIEADECADAYHNNKRIGFVTTTGPIEVDDRMPPLQPKITGWEVEKEYRGAGICKEMVRLIYLQYGQLEPADKNVGIGDVNALTDEGMGITRRCQKLGWIAPFEDEQPPPDDEEDHEDER